MRWPWTWWIERQRRASVLARQAACDHASTFSFGCTLGVTRCDKCGKMFGLDKAWKKLNADWEIT
jgi:hypothetical protein